jgi:hypothetical protein
MQLDIGWAYIAGVDPIALFKSHPGRFRAVAHQGRLRLKTGQSVARVRTRAPAAWRLRQSALGRSISKRVFANASLAGLKHFAVEHDNAAAWGDSLAAANVSYRNLARILS